MGLVKIQTNEQMIQREYREIVTIADVLHDCKADFSMPCGGNHTCGKCKVMATGCLSPMNSEEKKTIAAGRNRCTHPACLLCKNRRGCNCHPPFRKGRKHLDRRQNGIFHP